MNNITSKKGKRLSQIKPQKSASDPANLGVYAYKKYEMSESLAEYYRMSAVYDQKLLEYYLMAKTAVKTGTINKNTSRATWMKIFHLKSQKQAIKVRDRLIFQELFKLDAYGTILKKWVV